MRVLKFVGNWVLVMAISVVLIGLIECFYAWIIPIVYSWFSGNWVIGGSYHSGTGMVVLMFILIPAIIEFLCFVCIIFIFEKYGPRDTLSYKEMGFIGRLSAGFSIALAKFLPYYLLTSYGINAWLTPLMPYVSWDGVNLERGFTWSGLTILYCLFFGLSFLIYLFGGGRAWSDAFK